MQGRNPPVRPNLCHGFSPQQEREKACGICRDDVIDHRGETGQDVTTSAGNADLPFTARAGEEPATIERAVGVGPNVVVRRKPRDSERQAKRYELRRPSTDAVAIHIPTMDLELSQTEGNEPTKSD